MSAVIYIEGGGDRDENLARVFRRSWTKFFAAAGLEGRMPRVVRGGGRARTFDLFRTAIGRPRPGQVPLLLVDSEAAVAPGHSAWQHLDASDGWERPEGARDEQAFLMVQVMESWFLADRNAMGRYFGARFRENTLRQWPNLENVSKRDVEALHGSRTGEQVLTDPETGARYTVKRYERPSPPTPPVVRSARRRQSPVR